MSQKRKDTYTFEIYCLEDTLEAKHWQTLYKAFITHLGLLNGKFTVIFSCQDNVVRFFIRTGKDISTLSNAIDGFLLRPIASEVIDLPEHPHKELGLFNFVSGGNILDLREKLQIKKGRSLQFATISVRSLSYENAFVGCDLYFELPGKQWSVAHKTMTSFPAQLLAIDFANNTSYLKKSVPKYLNIEKSVHMLTSENVGALLEVDTFPYLPRNYYLSLSNYEFDKHSFIIGASGSGKSKFISLFVDRLQRNMAVATNYRVIIIDPHASLADDFEHIENKKVINFGDESTELFSGSSTDISAATELTGTLFKSLIGENATPKTERLLRFSLYVLLTAQAMSLGNLKRFLTETELRTQLIEHVTGYVPDNIVHFFGADFNELRTKYYNESISPIVSLIDEMQMQPALVGEGELSLSTLIQENFLTVFSLNKVSMGEKVVKTVAGLLIQQIFLLAQARVFNQRVLLIIDEVSVVQNPALAQILSEARKFNLTVMLTQQYFGQIDEDLQAAIFANVYNYYAFKVSEDDARALEGNLTIELPKELVEAEHLKGLKEQEVRVKIMTDLHPRECLVRVLANGQVVPAVKARTLDAPKGDGKPGSPPKLKPNKAANLPGKFDEKSARTEFAEVQPIPQAIPAAEAVTPTIETPLTPAAAPAAPETAPESAFYVPSFGADSPEIAHFDQPEETAESVSSGSSSPEAAAEAMTGQAKTPPEEPPQPDPYELHPEDRPIASQTKRTKLGALAATHYTPIGAAPGESYRPATSLQTLGPQTFNLSDLLAEHSSSRMKVNNKKGT